MYNIWHSCGIFQDGKEKPATPPIQLNIIHLLAELNVSIKKHEVVDMILPLFIESLEEGDASTPGLLRLRVSSDLFNKKYLCLLLSFLAMSFA